MIRDIGPAILARTSAYRYIRTRKLALKGATSHRIQKQLSFYFCQRRNHYTMNNIEMSNRDPYPFPKLENDSNFFGANMTQKVPYDQPTHIAQTEDPWNRLNSTCTLASSRREVYHYDPQAPKDSLDFILKANYDHHGELLKSRAETLTQPETLGTNHGRILKNRVIEKEEPPMAPTGKLNVVSIHTPKKESIHSVKGAIESHHTPATNQGFSRKHDGGFYTT